MIDRGHAWRSMCAALHGCGYVLPDLPAAPAVNGALPSLDEYAGVYRQLLDVAAQLPGRLAREDEMHGIVARALLEAQQAWLMMLADGTGPGGALTPAAHGASAEPAPAAPVVPTPAATDAAPAASEPPGDDAPPHRSPSLELVPLGLAALVPAAVRTTRRLPDEATLVRWLQRRRERGPVLPDESTIGRWRRSRPPRAPRQLPDESALGRYLRKRRSSYARATL